MKTEGDLAVRSRRGQETAAEQGLFGSGATVWEVSK